MLLRKLQFLLQKFAANKYAVDIKTDEKYVGTTVTYIATSERYNLVGTAEVKNWCCCN